MSKDKAYNMAFADYVCKDCGYTAKHGEVITHICVPVPKPPTDLELKAAALAKELTTIGLDNGGVDFDLQLQPILAVIKDVKRTTLQEVIKFLEPHCVTWATEEFKRRIEEL